MTSRLLFILFIFTLLSCSSGSKKKITDIEKVSTADLLETKENVIPLFDKLPSAEKAALVAFYKERNYSTQFYDKKGKLKPSGKLLIDYLNHSLYYGLPQKRIYLPFENSDSLPMDLVVFVKDAQISLGILRLLDDLQYGFSDSLRLADRKLNLGIVSIIDKIKEYTNNEQIDVLIKQNSSKNEHYMMLAEVLKQHLDTADISLKLFSVPLQVKDSTLSYVNALKNLSLKRFTYTGEELPIDVIKRYQKQNGIHPNGKIDEITKSLLEESPLDIAYKIAWNMEKIRYEVIYPKQFIRINIPAFKLYYFNEDTIVSINNVVVGKLKNQTPTLYSKINRIQVYPYWTVPYKIATKEIVPAMQANKNYLERNQMELLRGENVVNPHLINWKKLGEKNFPYKVRQQPGEKNSLGIIKFEFYNKYDVYVHDSPQKNLFKYPVRAYSHGCMRCQDPVELAKKMIEINEKNMTKGIIPDSLDSMITLKEQRSLYIKKGIPIYVEYTTVAITQVVKKEHKDKPDEYEEKIFYYRDIYFKDEENISLFFGKRELIPVAKN